MDDFEKQEDNIQSQHTAEDEPAQEQTDTEHSDDNEQTADNTSPIVDNSWDGKEETFNAEEPHNFSRWSNNPPNDPSYIIDMQSGGKKDHTALKTVSLALCCSLLGGIVGAGCMSIRSNLSDPVKITISDRIVSTDTSGSNSESLTDAEIYKLCADSTVSINAKTSINYFGQKVVSASAGSGFIISEDGYIVTNYHVISGTKDINITLYNGDSYEAEYIGGDEDYDVAILKIDAENLTPVVFGSSSLLNVGEHVIAIGNPLGELTFSMSGGMVSSVNRTINIDGTPFNMIQTDTTMNPGNSGGPLINEYGEVVGIVTAKYSTDENSESTEGLGFAIPIDDVISIIGDLVENGYVTNKPSMGIIANNMTEQMAAQYRYDITTGVFVCSTEEDSAAEKAGLRLGDVITAIDDTKIESMDDITAIKKQYSAGDTCTITIYRAGEYMDLKLTWDAAEQEAEEETEINNPYSFGQSGQSSMENIFDYFFSNR